MMQKGKIMSTFTEEYKKPLLVMLMLISSVVITYFTTDTINKYQITRQEAKIAALNEKVLKLTADKAAAGKESAAKLAEYVAAKIASDKAQEDIKNLPPKPVVPDAAITASYTSAEWLDQIALIETNRDVREILYVTDINALTISLKAADVSITALQGELVIANSLIATQKQTLLDNSNLNSRLAKELEVQTSRKKVYRGIAGGASLLLLAVVLL